MRRLLIFSYIAVIWQLVSIPLSYAAAEKAYQPVLINRCEVVLYQLYISNLNEDRWEESLIDNILDRGESKKVNFKVTKNNCRYDLMARDQNGQQIIWKNVDLCTEKKLILHHKNGRSWVTRYGEPNALPQSN